eukprot:52293-Pyramimonas_sp.AAC.1
MAPARSPGLLGMPRGGLAKCPLVSSRWHGKEDESVRRDFSVPAEGWLRCPVRPPKAVRARPGPRGLEPH